MREESYIMVSSGLGEGEHASVYWKEKEGIRVRGR